MKRALNRIFDFLNGTNVTVKWLILAFVAQLLISYVVSDYLNKRAIQFESEIAVRTAAQNEFKQLYSEFAISAGVLADRLRKNDKNISDAKDKVIENLRKQSVFVNEMVVGLPQDQQAALKLYVDQIAKTIEATQNTQDVLTASPFWRQTQALVEARSTVVEVLD